MKKVFYLKNISELDYIKNLSSEMEIIISPKKLSRLGELTLEQANQALKYCHQNQVPAFLEWDVLMTENDFQQCLKSLGEIDLEHVSAIRVQDIGAYHYLLANLSIDLHLIIESGNHNLVAIKKWEEVGKGKLKRFVLGLELPKNVIAKYKAQLSTACELQVLGKILLFYSPRSLLSRPMNSTDESIKVSASSEETPHKGFFVIENIHGTFMFLPKDQFLLDVFEEVKLTGVDSIRIDHRFLEGGFSLQEMISLVENEDHEKWSSFKENYANKLIRGYFNVNKSDAIFPKLKNYRTKKKTDNYIGKVVDVKKEQYLAISVFHHNTKKLAVGDKIEISSPDGKVKRIEVRSIRNIALENIQNVTKEKIILIPHVGGISVKAQVHFLG